jgi:hypothetical protein
MPEVRGNKECWDSSCERESGGQLIQEHNDAMWEMPHEVALEAWKDNETEPSLQSMWGEVKKERVLREALAEVQEIWRSLADEEKAWLAVCAGEGISKLLTKNRVARLKSLGNSIVPSVAQVFAKAILRRIEETGL